jgi:ABC-type Fe3+-hydroxamate transport system substrate-binding protein
MPQRPALFARKSDAGSPKVSRGAFLLLGGKILQQGRAVKEVAKARFRSMVCAVIAASLAGAAAARAQSAPAISGAAPLFREVTDEAGRTVRVPRPVRRIVSLAPSLTETVYALGLQDLLVGDTDYCDYPVAAQKKTKVGGAINPSLEQIAALHPDLVLVTKGLNRLETVRALDAMGISSYATDPHTVDEIITSTQKLADVLGVPEAGATVAADLQRRLMDLHQRMSALPPKRALFVVWTQPLISIGKGTFIADALRRAGAVSVVEARQSWPQVSLEEVARLQPEFLIFADSHSEMAPRAVEVLANLPGWRILDAVNNRRYAVISDAVNRPAPRIVTAIEDLARQLHPDAFVEKSESGKEKMENPPLVQPPFARSSFESRDLQSEMSKCGGRACAR